MRRIGVLLVAVLGLLGLAVAPDQTARPAQAAQTYTQVTVNCRGPVLDVMTGQPVTWGCVPWYVEAGDTILSHDWDGSPRYEYGGVRYHYLGSVSGPPRFFIVADCTQAAPLPVSQQPVTVSAPAAQSYSQVTATCSRPVLDVRTGQPVTWGGIPWYVEAGDAILSHVWAGNPRYEYGGVCYHYLGSISGPVRFFIVEECTQPPPAVPVTQLAPQTIRVAPDTYVYTDNNNTTNTYSSFFIVTNEGVIAGNPNGNARAARLKAAIADVTSQTVRYVIYSHASSDHDTGAGVFRDTATYIGHTNARGPIAARNNPDSPAPERTFDDRMTLSLGGVQLDLSYVGRNHGDSTIITHYPARRLAIVGDFIYAHGAMPFGPRLPADYVSEWIEAMKGVEAMDIDTIVPGHGGPTPKATIREIREYFGDLITAIEESERQGKVRDSSRQLEFVWTLLYQKYGRWEGLGRTCPPTSGDYTSTGTSWDALATGDSRSSYACRTGECKASQVDCQYHGGYLRFIRSTAWQGQTGPQSRGTRRM